ncbi:hypothetical protein C725_0550 [Pacificimonas flava]|uniref:Uncharacterized protein n=1 Tax=Pacificimonas flava TaxID=1234595 RepID=M2SGW6_9SPHN|nr:hypothetical protein C725_0550 [Pacificimonas flava]
MPPSHSRRNDAGPVAPKNCPPQKALTLQKDEAGPRMYQAGGLR